MPELLKRLRERQDKLAPVDAAFQISYELLTEELRRRWTLLAVFPASFDLRAAAAVWDEDEASVSASRSTNTDAPEEGSRGRLVPEALDFVRDTLQALVNVNLVEWNETNGRFRLHDLVRHFCDEKLSKDERTAVQFRHARHCCNIASESQEIYLRGGGDVLRGLELFDREMAHLKAAFEFLNEVAECNNHIGAQRGSEDSPACQAATLLISLLSAVGHTGSLRFHPHQIIRWWESLREVASIAKHRQAEGAALGNLGSAYLTLGDARKAIEFYKQALVIGQEIGDRHGEGAGLCNLGGAYLDLGDARKAIEFIEQALVIAREIGDRHMECIALGGLGRSHFFLSEAQTAIELHERQLYILGETGDRREEGNALGNLGLAHSSLGDTAKAIDFYQRQLVIVREIGDRFGEGHALGNLGNAYLTLREQRKAIEFHMQRLALAREICDRRGEGNALGNLGNTYLSFGEARKAIQFLEDQLNVACEIGDQRGEGTALFNSAQALNLLGDRAQAIFRCRAALQVLQAIESPKAALVRAKLGEWGDE